MAASRSRRIGALLAFVSSFAVVFAVAVAARGSSNGKVSVSAPSSVESSTAAAPESPITAQRTGSAATEASTIAAALPSGYVVSKADQEELNGVRFSDIALTGPGGDTVVATIQTPPAGETTGDVVKKAGVAPTSNPRVFSAAPKAWSKSAAALLSNDRVLLITAIGPPPTPGSTVLVQSPRAQDLTSIAGQLADKL